MAQLIRSAKSGNDWTDNELFAFNISIQDVDIATFFGVPQLPPTTVSPVILNNVHRSPPPAVISKEESRTASSSSHILRMLDFDDNDRSIVTKRELSFTMCGSRVWTKADIAVLDDAEYPLMVREDKRTTVTDEPKAQLIASAIAAFVENNQLRVPPLAQRTLPAMTMVGSCPAFYKIPVTQSLVDALVTAQYPAESTVVQRLVPLVPNLNQYRRHGMNPLGNSRIVFQCLEALFGFNDLNHGPTPPTCWRFFGLRIYAPGVAAAQAASWVKLQFQLPPDNQVDTECREEEHACNGKCDKMEARARKDEGLKMDESTLSG
ncbi:unnamed protein product [Cyclocybe aegerita]|uniref:Uncharacterized protein n=1 Tax=Cyclocybe aegerita TaxID=1973307 RepID=A0A8S0X2E6_CYCAE|nr:unnamed protein product [Cyclocybe aegerita]